MSYVCFSLEGAFLQMVNEQGRGWVGKAVFNVIRLRHRKVLCRLSCSAMCSSDGGGGEWDGGEKCEKGGVAGWVMGVGKMSRG